MTVDISRYPHSLIPLEHMFSKKNCGIEHIRRVTFDATNCDKTGPPSGYAYLFSLFNKHLKDDQLEYLRFASAFASG